MRHIIISLAILLGISIRSQEVYTAWQTTFATPAEVAGWQFIDGNNNNNTWNIGPHLVKQSNNNIYVEVPPLHVLRHTIYTPNIVSTWANYKPDYKNDVEDWAISPPIDLSSYGGTITLAAMIGRVITYNTTDGANNTNRDIFVYVSTPARPVPDVSDFQAIRAEYVKAYSVGNYKFMPPNLNINNEDYIAANNALFAQATADLSSYAGKKIYIALWNNRIYSDSKKSFGEQPFVNTNGSRTFQISEMQVLATKANMSTRDVTAKRAVTVYPNPVTDILHLKGISKASVEVYNATGQKVLSQTVSNGEINVSALSRGVYTLSIKSNDQSSTTQFIKR